LSPADDAVLQLWLDACRRRPGSLPDGVEPVQTRLIRAVGRGVLPDSGAVFLKTMGFPRGRDRIRYVHRALPAIHESAMLARVAEIGIACPAVVRAIGERRCGVPRLSVLVTAAIDGDDRIELRPAAALAAALADHGVFHPDLNRGNFLRRRQTGELAILDLQSARRFAGPLNRARRRKMAVKFVAELGADAIEAATAAVVSSGLVEPTEVDAIRSGVESMRRADVGRRIRRCTRTSSEFEAVRLWNGRVFRRRECATRSGDWVRRPDAIRLWIGDRALEVLDGTSPILGAMFRKSWWLRGENSVYIPHANELSFTAVEVSRLLEGFSRAREFLSTHR
jgi:hypothetical protein